MLRIGLTGGIGSGKSTVAEMLRERSYPVLDADALAREFLEPGQDAYKEVVAHFGQRILRPGGAVDRKKLASIVFADPEERAKLNQILHPRIREVVVNWFAALDRPDGPTLVFEDAALILESGARDSLDRIVVCWCRPEQQLERLLARGMSEEDARVRIAAQMPIDQKRKLADEVIDCSGSIAETEKQVDQVLAKLRG